MAKKIIGPKANCRQSWYEYYVQRFNQLELPTSAHMAMFYLFLLLSEGDHTYGANKPRFRDFT